MVGAAGDGKDTGSRSAPELPVISLDDLRDELDADSRRRPGDRGGPRAGAGLPARRDLVRVERDQPHRDAARAALELFRSTVRGRTSSIARPRPPISTRGIARRTARFRAPHRSHADRWTVPIRPRPT